ncbi:UNVERIFIED_CONTAM: hypothetical protein Sradi_0264900 [Sesamum radiatum]|uniref:Uncharacterized protein n=1 Tax=Sesamum radiatum TaxID=300843 RepID=A0AAW2W607_SESRA
MEGSIRLHWHHERAWCGRGGTLKFLFYFRAGDLRSHFACGVKRTLWERRSVHERRGSDSWASGPRICAVSQFKCGQPQRRVPCLPRTATPRVGERV